MFRRKKDKDKEIEERWDRAFEEADRAREEGRLPDLSKFDDLTKAVGGWK